MARTTGVPEADEGDAERSDAGPSLTFQKKAVDVGRSHPLRVATKAIRSLVTSGGADNPIVVTYSDGAQAAMLKAELGEAKLDRIGLLGEARAAMELIELTRIAEGYDTVAIYDLGATGLSVTFVDAKIKRALGAARSTTVSGNMFDWVVREHLVRSEILQEPTDDAAEAEINTFCRGVKESLSTSALAQTPGGGILLMTRGQFDQAVYLQLEESAKIVSEVGLRCGRNADVVVLIGGGARIPVVRTVLERWLGVPVVAADEPEMVVAKGAALFAMGHRDREKTPRAASGPVETPPPRARKVDAEKVSAPTPDATKVDASSQTSSAEKRSSDTASKASPSKEKVAAGDVAGKTEVDSSVETPHAATPPKKRATRFNLNIPMFAGLVLSAFAVCSVVLWAANESKIGASGSATPQSVVADADNVVDAESVTPASDLLPDAGSVPDVDVSVETAPVPETP